MRAVKRAVARRIRAALLRYVRAQPPPDEVAGAHRRVFILLTTAWGMGGTIRSVLNLAGYLAGRYEVEIISIGRGRDEPFFGAFAPGVHVVALDDRRPGKIRWWRHPVRGLLRSRSSLFMHPKDRAAPGFSLWVDVMLARTLRRRAGFLIATRPGLNMVAAQLAPPGLITIGEEQLHLHRHPAALRRAMTRLYPRLDVLRVLTEDDRRAYDAHLKGRLRVVRIPNTVRELDGPDADLAATTVLAVGRLSPQKGYDLLIPAFARVVAKHSEWRLRICGAGPKRAELEATVREHDLEHAIALPGPAADVGAEMARASIFVLSSRFEGLPLVLLEAMSKGMAVVSFDCPTGPADVIDDRRNGILVPTEDVDALAAGILELIEHDDLRRECAAGALESAARYKIAAVGPRWELLFEELIDARSPAWQ